ncbi:MAG: outer membrane beta-barrel protein, partial [Ignavibacteriaceae bacterium]
LLTKMPGIVVQNGIVQAQGENVTQVLVDGKPFFGDPNTALQNLPAEVIDKIQVYDQLSDQSQFTGFDDGNTSKTLNIVTKMKDKPNIFGRFLGGYGDDGRYSAGGNINFFNDNQRISIISQINNINIQNFSTADLLGVMSGSGRSFNRPGGGGGSGLGGNSSGNTSNYGGGAGGAAGGTPSISNFLVNQSTGLTTTKAIGLNYSNKWGNKVDLTASYFFNYTSNDAESIDNRNYFFSNADAQSYNATNSALTNNTNNRFNVRLNYQIDSSNSILFTPTYSNQLNDGLSKVYGASKSGIDTLNTSYNVFNSDLTAVNSSNNLLIRHKFETVGRTLSLLLNGTFTSNSGNNNLNAENVYYSNGETSDTTGQHSNLSEHGYSTSANLVYTEPINSLSLLQLDSKIYYSEDNSNQKTYNTLDQNNFLLDSLSNVYKKIYKSQNVGAGYRFREDEVSIALNLNYNIAQLEDNQTFPNAGSMERSFYSVLPSFFLRYYVSRNNNLRISYTTTNNDPSITQLQNVLNNSNTTQLTIGNPGLSQDYKQSLTLRYIQTNNEHSNAFFVFFNATAIQNYIGNKTIIAEKDTTFDNVALNPGTKLSIPENLNGYIKYSSYLTYGFPINLIKSNLNLNVNVNYSRIPGIIDNLDNYANSDTYVLGFVLGSNISDRVDFTLSTSNSYNHVTNSSTMGTNSNYYMQNSAFNFYWRFWAGFVFQNELTDQYNGDVSSPIRKNTLIWNMSMGVKFLKNDNGELRFTANDILNQNVSIQHNVTDTYTEDVRTNVLGRYFLLSFIYNVRVFNY